MVTGHSQHGHMEGDTGRIRTNTVTGGRHGGGRIRTNTVTGGWQGGGRIRTNTVTGGRHGGRWD